MSDPDQIRNEIEATRAELSGDVNALAGSVKPGNVARRQADKVRSGVSALKDNVMGTAEDLTHNVKDTASDLGQSASGAAGGTKSAVRQKARGNPLAAGLVAFAAGWLVSSLIPATEAEQQGATALKERAEPLKEQVTSAVKEVASNLQEPARDAVEQVKSSATDSAQTVKEEAQGAASDVKGSSQEAAGRVREQA
jgi:cell division septum initiation protein DivIVA